MNYERLHPTKSFMKKIMKTHVVIVLENQFFSVRNNLRLIVLSYFCFELEK